MLFLVSYENATSEQDNQIRNALKDRSAKQVLNNVWIVEANDQTVISVMWGVKFGENLRILVAEVSHSHFATSPYCDVRGMFRKTPGE